jgi:hypothetical protein
MSMLPVPRRVSNCEFWGGPWCGREMSYPHLFPYFFVPDVIDVTTVVLPNFALANARGEFGGTQYAVHVYQRATVIEHTHEVYAKYYYKGTR